MKAPFVSFAILLMFLTPSVRAQSEGESQQKFHLGVYGGPYLPSNFTGVTETLNVIGARASLGEDVFKFELNGFRSSEKGITVNYIIGSLALHLDIPNVDFLRVVVMGGLQSTYYRRAPSSTGQTYPYARGSGVHMGGGFLIPFNPKWSLRTQYTIFNGPGRTVLVEAGLEYSFGADSEPVEEPTSQR